MTSLDTTQRPLSLAERAAKALGKPSPVQEKSCLLLDVSGSMCDAAEPGVRKIDALRNVIRTLEAPVIFAFSRRCKRVTRETIPEPEASTALHIALAHVRGKAITRVVLVTDGLPDDEAAAIEQARGLSLEIIYVGPVPKPAFLDRLAAVARPGSRAHQASLGRASAVRQLLLSAGTR